MTDEGFDHLAQRVEGEFRKNPSLYRTKVALLAVLGYAYLLLIAGVCLGLAGVLVWLIVSSGSGILGLKLAIPLAALGVAVIHSLWVDFPEPEGVPVTPADAPALYALVNGLADQASAPRPDRILLNAECNAAVVQRPHLGPLGFYENILILGVPLLGVLSPSQATAVLAHEFGHLARGHGRFGSWIDRIRTTWHQLDQELQASRKAGARLIRGFLEWYAPYFGAYSQVLIRQHEFAADEFAAGVVGGAGLMAEALITLRVRMAACEEFGWQGLWGQARTVENPPEGSVRSVLSFSQQALQARWGQTVIARSLLMPQLPWDTHPPLKARLEALGVDATRDIAPPVAKVEQSALFHFLGEPWLTLVDRVDEYWRGRVAFSWRKRFVDGQRSTHRIAELNALEAKEGKLSLALQWERAERVASVEGPAATEPLLRAMLVEMPDHAGANYNLGGLLLERDDPAGLAMLESAAARSPAVEAEIRETIASYWERQGRTELAEASRAAAANAAVAWSASRAEREGFTKGDRVLPHALDLETLKRLQIMLRKEPRVARAWFGRKAVQHLPDHPYYVLVVQLDGLPFWPGRKARNAAAIQELVKAHGYPGPTWVAVSEGKNKWALDSVRAVPGSEVSDPPVSR